MFQDFHSIHEDLVRLETDRTLSLSAIGKKQAFYLQYNQPTASNFGSSTKFGPMILKTKLDQFHRDQMSTYVQLLIDYYKH